MKKGILINHFHVPFLRVVSAKKPKLLILSFVDATQTLRRIFYIHTNIGGNGKIWLL